MEGINVDFMVALLTMMTLGGFPRTAAISSCGAPEESLENPPSSFPGTLWPNGRVTYELHSSLTPVDVREVMQTIYHIQSKTCIRFAQRAGNESSYVSIEHDDSVCGSVNDYCCTGGFQFAKFGWQFKRWSVMVHELCHILCLRHEVARKDRDDYVNFPNCSEDQIPGKNNFATGGHFFDYTSQMAKECNSCAGGFPKMDGVTYCALDVQDGLSVLDADKINDLYGCKKCFSHRWRRTENLTVAEKGELFSFGKTVDSKDLYLCRTYVTGEIAPGQYDLENHICTVTFNGKEFQVREKVQVFTVPDEKTRKGYVVSESKDYLVPVGRTALAVTIYAAFAEIEDNKNMHTKVIGKVYADDFCTAYFSNGHVEVTKSSFSILGCF